MAFSAGSSSATLPSVSSEINVTPLIDVLLVLLIIFMVIAPMTPRGLDSVIPRASTAAEQADSPLSVRLLVVGASGESGRTVVYEIDGRVVLPGELKAVLVSSLGRRANRSVFISASPEVRYQAVAALVGQARAAGATAVALGRL